MHKHVIGGLEIVIFCNKSTMLIYFYHLVFLINFYCMKFNNTHGTLKNGTVLTNWEDSGNLHVSQQAMLSNTL